MPDRPPNIHYFQIWIIIFLAIAIGWSLFVTYDNRSNHQDLKEKHYDLAWKVSGIEIKWDDTARQQEAIIRDIYRIEILDAIDIASQAGFDHTIFVEVSGYQVIDTVRLRDTHGSEIEVNVQSKVITTYSPQ